MILFTLELHATRTISLLINNSFSPSFSPPVSTLTWLSLALTMLILGCTEFPKITFRNFSVFKVIWLALLSTTHLSHLLQSHLTFTGHISIKELTSKIALLTLKSIKLNQPSYLSSVTGFNTACDSLCSQNFISQKHILSLEAAPSVLRHPK